jgi:hypothetical protein
MKELTEFPDQLAKMLALIEQNRQRLETDMNSGLAASEGAGFNSSHSRDAVALAKAAADLGREVRAWLGDLDKKVRNLGQEKHVSLAVSFLQSLPASVRYSAYDKLMSAELKRTDGIKLSVPVRKIEPRKKKFGGKPRSGWKTPTSKTATTEGCEGSGRNLDRVIPNE